MKLLIALCLVAVVASAPPPRASKEAQITKYYFDNNGYGDYKYSFGQDDNQRAEQSGQLINEGKEDEYLAVTGSYSWVGPDGVTYIVNYKADQNGYQPEIEQGPGGALSPAVLASLVG